MAAGVALRRADFDAAHHFADQVIVHDVDHFND
jgi:hypothetical protein